MSRWSVLLSILLLGLSSSWLPSRGFAQGAGEEAGGGLRSLSEEKQKTFKEHVLKAAEHFKGKRYNDAIVELKAAQTIHDDPHILYRMGQAQELTGAFDDALASYRRYLKLLPQAHDRAQVEVSIRVLEDRLERSQTKLAINSEPKGAAVYLDGDTALAGYTPLELKIRPGRHTVAVVKEGYRRVEVVVEVRARERTSRMLTMPAIAGASVKANGEKAAGGDEVKVVERTVQETSSAAPLVLALSGGTLGVLGGALLLIADGEARRLDALDGDRESIARPSDYDALEASYNRKVIVGWSAAGLGVALLAGSTLLWLLDGPQEAPATQQGQSSRAQLGVTFPGRGGLGFGITGSF